MSEKNDPNPETQPVRPTTDPTADAPAPVPSTPDSSADPAPVDPAPAAAAPADPAPADPAPVSAAPGQPARRSLRDRFAGTGDRMYGTRGLIAATLAALIVGGFGGAAIHAAVDDDHGRFFRGNHPGDMGRDFGDFGGRMGEGERPGPPGDFFPQPPGGVPGQLPPTTTPEDGDSSPTPAPSESPSESSSS